MTRPVDVNEWGEVDISEVPDGSWETMMGRVARFHLKHDFANPDYSGQGMGCRLALG